MVPRPDRALQDTAHRGVRAIAEDVDGEDSEVRAARMCEIALSLQVGRQEAAVDKHLVVMDCQREIAKGRRDLKNQWRIFGNILAFEASPRQAAMDGQKTV